MTERWIAGWGERTEWGQWSRGEAGAGLWQEEARGQGCQDTWAGVSSEVMGVLLMLLSSLQVLARRYRVGPVVSR